MHKFKLLKPLPLSSIVWALIITAAVLLIASGASAQEETSTSSTPAAEPARSVPPAPAALTTTRAETPSSTSTVSAPATPAVDLRSQRTAQIEERMANVQARRAALEAKRVELQSATSARRALLRQEVQERALTGMARVASVLASSINRSRDFVQRLEARIDELESAGVVVTNAPTLLAEATEYLDLAAEALRDLDVNARYAITSDTPRTDWPDVREQFATVRQALREAHLLLRSAAAELRGAITIEASSEDESSSN